jgi:nucleoside-diphosphate-sugar epimerase
MLGPAVVRALVDAGHTVTAWVRRAEAAALFPPHVTVVTGDLRDEAAMRAAVAGADGIVHLAAELHRTHVTADLRDVYVATNVDATRRLMDVAAEAGVRRVVFTSTIAVYQAGHGAAITEDSPVHGSTVYAETKLRAERDVLAARTADGAPLGTVLRLAAVYGPGVKGNYQKMVTALDRGWFVPIGAGANHRALIYVDDAAAAVVAALVHPAAAGKVYNISDGVGHTLADIIGAICAALGRVPPRLAVPAGVARAGIKLVETLVSAIGRRAPVSVDQIDKYTEDVVVDSSRAHRELGRVPRTSLLAGWQETVRAMRATGALSAAKNVGGPTPQG